MGEMRCIEHSSCFSVHGVETAYWAESGSRTSICKTTPLLSSHLHFITFGSWSWPINPSVFISRHFGSSRPSIPPQLPGLPVGVAVGRADEWVAKWSGVINSSYMYIRPSIDLCYDESNWIPSYARLRHWHFMLFTSLMQFHCAFRVRWRSLYTKLTHLIWRWVRHA